MKLRPWTEWTAKSRDWLVGFKVRITFEEFVRILRLRPLRKPAKPNSDPNPSTHD